MDLAIAKPLTLQCGLELPNRLGKAAMAESWADKEGLPHRGFQSAYSKWGKGGWGLALTGNVMVDEAHLGHPKDIAVTAQNTPKLLTAWKAWAKAANPDGTSPTIMQLNHPGRQSPMGAGSRGLFAKSLAPSAVPLGLGPGLVARGISALVFGTPAEMTSAQIQGVVTNFATAARLATEAGFDGVEIHAAHGYLLAQFLSPKTNLRVDEYGGTAAKRARIVVDVVRAVRDAVPAGFAVAIKLNSADVQKGGDLADTVEQLRLIVAEKVDFLEISGGTYEDPEMLKTSNELQVKVPIKASTAAREAFFLDFAREIRSSFPNTPLMVSGGFRSRTAMEAAVSNGECELVGLARPAALAPALPREVLLDPSVSDEDAKLVTTPKAKGNALLKFLGLSSLGARAETLWYAAQIQKM